MPRADSTTLLARRPKVALPRTSYRWKSLLGINIFPFPFFIIKLLILMSADYKGTTLFPTFHNNMQEKFSNAAKN